MSEPMWVSDNDLGLTAHRLGEKIVEMYLKAGLGPVGTFGPDYDGTFVESVILDAMDFATLDPQKIIDEADRMRSVWRALANDDQAEADVRQAATHLTTFWSGEAADRFHDQMTYIEKFLESHAEFVAKAVVALGMMFVVAVRARRNFLELAEGMIVACEQEMAAQADRDAEADLKRTATMVNSVLELFGGSPAEMVKGGVQATANVVAVELENDLKKSGAPQVVEAYTRVRADLRADFAEALAQIQDWIGREHASVVASRVSLLVPLPASYDPSSPDFRYEVFASGYRPAEQFGPRVERQRVDERAADPDSAVSRRLGAR